MTGEVFTFLKGVIAQFWILFTSWYVPGTNITVGGWLLFLLSAGVLFRFLCKLGFGSFTFNELNALDKSNTSGSSEVPGQMRFM